MNIQLTIHVLKKKIVNIYEYVSDRRQLLFKLS